MKWYTYLICLILITAGIFCALNLAKLFSVTSGEYGSVITFESKNNYIEVTKFDYGSVDFDTTDYTNYISIETAEPNADFNGLKENYLMFFNDQPLNNVEQTAGRISGNLSIKFYDTNGGEITTADLTFIVEYLANNTKITITISDDNNSVSYFNAYTEINGAVLKVVKQGENV